MTLLILDPHYKHNFLNPLILLLLFFLGILSVFRQLDDYLLRIELVAVKVAMVHILPAVLLEWFPISYSATCLFDVFSSSEAMELIYWYPTVSSLYSWYRISW